MPQPAAALSFTNMMNPHLFFFALSISFLLFPHALPCGKPVGPFMCLPRGNFIFCLRRLAFYRTHDREIALWNARMRIYLYATFLEDANRLCQEIDSRFLHSFGSFGNSELNSSFVHKALDFFNHRIVWDAATCGGTLNNKHDEPTSFFFSSSL